MSSKNASFYSFRVRAKLIILKHNRPWWPWRLRHGREKLSNSRSCPWSPYVRIYKSSVKNCRKYVNNVWHNHVWMQTQLDRCGRQLTFGWWETIVNLDVPPCPKGRGDINMFPVWITKGHTGFCSWHVHLRCLAHNLGCKNLFVVFLLWTGTVTTMENRHTIFLRTIMLLIKLQTIIKDKENVCLLTSLLMYSIPSSSSFTPFTHCDTGSSRFHTQASPLVPVSCFFCLVRSSRPERWTFAIYTM